jgi:hypothetical protein
MDTLGSMTALDCRPGRGLPERPQVRPGRWAGVLPGVLAGVLPGVLAGVLLGACRAPAPARSDAAVRQPVQVRMTPAEFPARARQPGSALILGAGGTDRATLLPLAPEPGAVLVRAPGGRALLVAAWLVPALLAGGAPAGSVAPGAAVAPAAGAGPGVAQAPVAWAALRAAAHTLGKDPTELGLAVVAGTDAGAALRDPLAGPAIAAGLLASLTGSPVRPGGAVGPGLLLPDHTVLALPAAGKAAPPAAGKAAPPAAGKAALPAAELADVRAAHALRTGTVLPGPWPVKAETMALSPALRRHLVARHQEHRQALMSHWALLLGLPPGERLPASLRALIDSAQPHVSAAERAHARGKVLAAHEHLIAATPAATAAAVLWQALERLRAGDTAGAQIVVDALAARAGSDVAAALGRIQDARPSTLAGHVHLAHAVEEWLIAAGMHAVAVALLSEHAQWFAPAPAPDGAEPGTERGQRAQAERTAEALAPAILALARAQAHAIWAADALLLPEDAARHGGEAATPYRCAAPELSALAAQDLAVSGASRGLGAGAPPNLAERLQRARLQAALTHGQHWAGGPGAATASAPGTATASAPGAATPSAPGTPTASAPGTPTASGPATAASAPGTPTASGPATAASGTFATACTRAVAALAAAELARVEHGRLDLARHGTRARVAALVARADRAARQHARAAQAATGFIPASTQLAFLAARQRARMNDPAGALVRFWAASLHAELAVTLARHAR